MGGFLTVWFWYKFFRLYGNGPIAAVVKAFGLEYFGHRPYVKPHKRYFKDK
jgi:hypothetical protein